MVWERQNCPDARQFNAKKAVRIYSHNCPTVFSSRLTVKKKRDGVQYALGPWREKYEAVTMKKKRKKDEGFSLCSFECDRSEQQVYSIFTESSCLLRGPVSWEGSSRAWPEGRREKKIKVRNFKPHPHKTAAPAPAEPEKAFGSTRARLCLMDVEVMRDEIKQKNRAEEPVKTFIPSFLLKCCWALWSVPLLLFPPGLGQQVARGSEGQPQLTNSPGPLLLAGTWMCLRPVTELHHRPLAIHTHREHSPRSDGVMLKGNRLSNLFYCPWPPVLCECFNPGSVILVVSVIHPERELRFYGFFFL